VDRSTLFELGQEFILDDVDVLPGHALAIEGIQKQVQDLVCDRLAFLA